MLILSRKPGQRIHIDGPAVVTVHRVVGGAVKLGVEADLNVEVQRGEIHERIRLERAKALAEGGE